MCAPLQVPREITILDTGLYHLLPLEVAWWFLWKCNIQPGSWVVVITNKPNLVGSLAVRAGVGLNLLWGVSEVEVEDTTDLNPYVDALQAQVRVADGLPPVQWNQSFKAPLPDLRLFFRFSLLKPFFMQTYPIVLIYAHMRVLLI